MILFKNRTKKTQCADNQASKTILENPHTIRADPFFTPTSPVTAAKHSTFRQPLSYLPLAHVNYKRGATSGEEIFSGKRYATLSITLKLHLYY